MPADPAVARIAAALRPWLDREHRFLATPGAGGWDGKSGWRAQCSAIQRELFDAVEAAGWWSPPGERADPSGDDPLRAARRDDPLRAGPAHDPED